MASVCFKKMANVILEVVNLVINDLIKRHKWIMHINKYSVVT